MTKRHRRKRKRTEGNGEEQITILGGGEPLDRASESEDFALTSPLPDSSPAPTVDDAEASVVKGTSGTPSADEAPAKAPVTRDPAPTAQEVPRASPLTLDELLARGDFVQAIPVIEAGLEETPNDLTLLLAAGRAYSCSGDYQRAQAMLDHAFETWPEDLRIQREMGITLFRRGLYSECAEALSIVCARSESDGEAYYYRGEALNRSGQTEDAMRTLEKAVRLSPENNRALRSLGRIYDRLGMMDLAAEMHGRARPSGDQRSDD